MLWANYESYGRMMRLNSSSRWWSVFVILRLLLLFHHPITYHEGIKVKGWHRVHQNSFFGHFVINCRKIFALVSSFFMMPDCYFASTNVFERRNPHSTLNYTFITSICVPPIFVLSTDHFPIPFSNRAAAAWPVLSRPNAVFSDFFALHIPYPWGHFYFMFCSSSSTFAAVTTTTNMRECECST